MSVGCLLPGLSQGVQVGMARGGERGKARWRGTDDGSGDQNGTASSSAYAGQSGPFHIKPRGIPPVCFSQLCARFFFSSPVCGRALSTLTPGRASWLAAAMLLLLARLMTAKPLGLFGHTRSISRPSRWRSSSSHLQRRRRGPKL